METVVSVKNISEDGFAVEYGLQPVVDISNCKNDIEKRIASGLASAEDRLAFTEQKIRGLNTEVDRLTCAADGIDYTIAVASGIICGIIDSVWVGEFSLDRANEWGNEKVNNFVVKVAQQQGYKGDDLAGAVAYLEDKYSIAADKATNAFGGGLQHHLRDFSHHPTPIGLIFSLLTQFTSKVYGTDTAGNFKVVPITGDDLSLIGKNIPEKITFGVVYWFFHMVSDMAGSSRSIAKGKAGTGLPGPLVSLLKEISALPIFKKLNEKGYKEFSVWISKLFNGTLLAKRDENGKIIESVKFDLRTEIGVIHELGRQSVPIVFNECIVRGFYFIRHLCCEIRDNDVRTVYDLATINLKKTLPFKNRTIMRMLTISCGTFTAIDLGDAAVRSAIKSGGVTNPAFFGNFILCVNFVGIGRFAVAIGSDVGMGIRKNKTRNERISAYNEQIALLNAKVFYKQANMWIAAQSAEEVIIHAESTAKEAIAFYKESMRDISNDLEKIGEYIPGIEIRNPGLIDDIKNILEW